MKEVKKAYLSAYDQYRREENWFMASTMLTMLASLKAVNDKGKENNPVKETSREIGREDKT